LKQRRADRDQSDAGTGEEMNLKWVDGFEIRVGMEKNAVVISANREGLLSLASQLTALANESAGSHIHYDEYNSLENNSSEMIIEKSE
jgi:hypothetical protein